MKIINLSLDKGEFSAQWKSQAVHPLIKSLSKGTTNNNYRPVSNLPFISEVAEKCTLQQFIYHCNTYNLLPEYQSVYRQNSCCETILLKLTNDTLWGMEKQDCSHNWLSSVQSSTTYCLKFWTKSLVSRTKLYIGMSNILNQEDSEFA